MGKSLRSLSPRSLWRLVAAVVALALAACGGQVGVTGGGGVSGAGGTGATGGNAGAAGMDAGAGAGAGWTSCSAPHWKGCGTADCPAGRPGCFSCITDAGLMGPCAESLLLDDVLGKPSDGTILLSLQDSFVTIPFIFTTVPFNAGILVAKHGQAARLGYADYGVWTGAPLPMPRTCPSIPDVPTCGGYCGGCPVGQICTGRSSLHPYGICIPESAGVCSRVANVNGSLCSADEGCFIFKVEPAHQLVANAHGFCVPAKECQALAAKLPGGGRCE